MAEKIVGDLSQAISAVSTMDIVLAFDVPYRMHNGHTYLLCPGHDDTHFGSCYIDKNDDGYYCYVCNEHVNKWNMVLKLNGGKKSDAAKWFFQQSGITPKKEPVNDAYKKAITLIKDLEKYICNVPVYDDIYTCMKQESSYGRNINSEYMYSKRTIANPLLELYTEDKATFKIIAANALETALHKIQSTMNYCTKDKVIYTKQCGLLGFDQFKTTCEKEITAIKQLKERLDQM